MPEALGDDGGERGSGSGRGRGRRLAISAIGGLGALDVASFLWSRRGTIFREAPGRARGSVAGLLLWTGLAVAGAAAPAARPARSLAWTCGMSNLALYAIHLKVGKGRARGLWGAILGALAIAVGG